MNQSHLQENPWFLGLYFSSPLGSKEKEYGFVSFGSWEGRRRIERSTDVNGELPLSDVLQASGWAEEGI